MPVSNPPTIIVFDSGVGGLSVFNDVRAARPDARYIYIADDAGFPYGNLSEDALITRVTAVLGEANNKCVPDLVVIACNTASTVALSALRARFTVPFVGTVPAIKPACAQSKSKLVSVLGTQATVTREYTHALIREFASDCEVALVGSPKLATFAELELAGTPVSDDAIKAEIAPCFVEKDGRRTDTVVLACTHYPLLIDRFRANAPWPVEWIDPAPAIARRVGDLLRDRAPGGETENLAPKITFTSGRTPPPALMAALTKFGF
jgi:glutamate racemase